MATLSALQHFGFLWTPAAKATCLQELAGCFKPRLTSDSQNRTLAKNGSYIQILDITLVYQFGTRFLSSGLAQDMENLLTESL